MAASIEIFHWGVHWAEDDVAWLHQTRGGMPTFFAKDVQSPFFIRRNPARPCNHIIAPTMPNPAREHLEAFRRLIEEDELVRLMLPMPKDALLEPNQGVALLRTDKLEETQTRLTILSRMSNPIRIPIVWLGLVRMKDIMAQLDHTNVQPLVVMGARAEHDADLTLLRRAAANMPRRLVVVGNYDMPWAGAEVVSTRMANLAINDLIALPMEALGSMALRGYMRREWSGSWFTREPTPANEVRVRPGTRVER